MIRRAFLALLLVSLMATGLTAGGRWEVLGERQVNDRLDHDTIMVTGAKGTFKSIRLEVRRHSVDFHRVVIHFADGEDQRVELRHTIPAGGETRDRKSTRLNSSHLGISYAVFCLKKKK